MIDMREAARKLVLGAAWWSGAASLASPFLAGAGAILMLHRVTDAQTSPLGINSHLAVSPRFLDRLLADIRRRGLAIVGLDEMLEGAAAGRRGMVAITADDGWLDNLTEALPVFEAHGAPFTVYVAPGLTGGGVLPWWEVIEERVERGGVVRMPAGSGLADLDCGDASKRRAAATALMRYVAEEVAEEDQQAFLRTIGAAGDAPRRFMNWDEVRRLAAHPLATIGAHTVHHYNLKRLPREAALREMVDSASIIEAETGRRPRHFAFPYGYESAVGAAEVALAEEAGFESAVTTRHGVIHAAHAHHRHALPRISVNGRFQGLSYMRTLMSGAAAPLANRGRRFVTV